MHWPKSAKDAEADMWILIWEELTRVHQEGIVVEVEHVTAHRWVCQSCGMGGCWPTRQSCYICGAPRLGGDGGQRPPRETHYPGQPSNQGLPINPTKMVLRCFNGGTGQSPPKVVPTGLCFV